MVNNELKQKSEHKSRKSVDSVKSDKFRKRKHSSSRDSSRSKSPIHKKRHSGKKQKTRHKKRSRSTSSNSSSTDSDKERERKKRKKAKKKAKKIIKELKKIQKRKEKSESKIRSKNVESNQKDSKPCNDVPLELMDKSRSMAPMTKEEWEKRQSVVKRVYDEETGRHRLIKGDGEVIEEIVSRDRHKAINKQATQGDGDFFQKRLNLDVDKK